MFSCRKRPSAVCLTPGPRGRRGRARRPTRTSQGPRGRTRRPTRTAARRDRAVVLVVLLARQRGAPGRGAARAVGQRPVGRLAHGRGAAQRAGEGDHRRGPRDAPVVARAPDHLEQARSSRATWTIELPTDLLLDGDLLRRLRQARARPVAVEEEGVGVLVVHEDEPLAAAAQREVGEEVVVEAVAQLLAPAGLEGVVPADQHVGPEARGHLEDVVRRGGDRVERGEGRARGLGGGRLGPEEVEAHAVQGDGGHRARPRGGDPADEGAPGRARGLRRGGGHRALSRWGRVRRAHRRRRGRPDV